MQVLVAGDRGYLGAVLVPFLQAHGHRVVGLDAGWYDGCDFGRVPPADERGRATCAMPSRTTSLASTRW